MLLFRELLRARIGEKLASLYSAVFICVFQFGRYTDLAVFSAILPYSHAATIGLAALLAQLVLLGRVWRKGLGASTALFALASAAGLLVKIEVFAATLAVAAVALFAMWERNERLAWRRGLRALGLAALLTFVLGFLMVPSLEGWALLVKEHVRLARLAGGTSLAGNLLAYVELLMSSAVFALIIAAAWFWARKHRAAAALLFACAAFLLWRLPNRAFLFLNLLLPFLALRFGIGFRRGKKRSFAAWEDAALAAAGAVFLLRVFPFASADHYGFYLAVPAFAALAVFLHAELPTRLPAPALATKRALALAFAGFWIVAIFAHARITYFFHAGRGLVAFDSGGGRMRVIPGIAAALGEFREELGGGKANGKKLLAMPEGLILNYLAGTRPRTYFFASVPFYTAGDALERFWIGEIEREAFDYIVVVDRWTDEYGASVFGRDYFTQGRRFILERYAPMRTLEAVPFSKRGVFGMQIFERRP